MTTKEVEEQLGVSRATIRFYEKEKLIVPKRYGNTYREYSEDDIVVIKKIIILRKLGFSIVEIKELLEEEISLQELLEKNILELQEKMSELSAAIKVCKKMQNRQENFASFNVNFYWEEIKEQEKAGNKFLEIVNDSIGYEKQIFFQYFELLDEEGNMYLGKKEMVQKVIKAFLMAGVISFIFGGLFWGELGINHFLRGLSYPVIGLGIGSLFGLPWYFIKKKYPQISTVVKRIVYRIVMAIPVVVSFIIILFAIFK